LLGELVLRGTAAVGSAFTVVTVKTVNDVQAVGHHAEGRKAHAIETLVVAIVDEHLGGAGIRPGSGEAHIAADVALRDRIILDFGFFPRRGDGRVGADAELRHERRIVQHAEETGVVIKVVLDQIVKAVRAKGRPCTRDGDGEVAFGGGDFHLICIRGFVFQERGMQQRAIVSGRGRGGFVRRRGGLREQGRPSCQNPQRQNC